MSDAFGGALPSVVLREWARLPVGMLDTILEYRHYAATKADYDRDSAERPDESALRQLVRRIEFEIVAEDRAARQRQETDAE